MRRLYLHENNDHKIIVSSFKLIENHKPKTALTMYKERVHLYAPWLLEYAKGHLKVILKRTMKTVLTDVVHLHILANDPIMITFDVPKDKIIPSSDKSVCPSQLEPYKINKNIELNPINTNKPRKQKMTLAQAQEKLKRQVKDL